MKQTAEVTEAEWRDTDTWRRGSALLADLADLADGFHAVWLRRLAAANDGRAPLRLVAVDGTTRENPNNDQ